MVYTNIQGEWVNCGEGHLAGREVDGVVAINFQAHSPGDGQVWIVVNENHGEYDIDWICVFEGGKEKRRIQVSACAEIEWKEQPGEQSTTSRGDSGSSG